LRVRSGKNAHNIRLQAVFFMPSSTHPCRIRVE
jgi:hypothetical protein